MRHRDYQHRRQRVFQMPYVEGGCEDRNEIWLWVIMGSPTGGTFDAIMNVQNTTETLTFDWDMIAADVQTELETHTNIASGDVEVTGGPYPDAFMAIEFKGVLANTRMVPAILDFSNLTGGTGVGIILARYQPGHPKDGAVAP